MVIKLQPAMRCASEVSFERVGDVPGERLCIFHAPVEAPLRGLILHVHPFAEEMNKSRRMAAIQSRALASCGFAVLQFDLLGCGDSDGEFADATWAAWLGDVLWAFEHLKRRGADLLNEAPFALPTWIWGHRLGGLLAVQAAQEIGTRQPVDLLLWQPVLSGRTALQQFLRLKAAGALVKGGAMTGTEELRQQLLAGQAVEVAGYELNPLLATGMDAARLTPPLAAARLCWIETGSSASSATSPAATRTVQAWREQGWDAELHAVQGPQFWQTTEIEDAPALVECTCSAVLGQTSLDVGGASKATPEATT